MFFFKRTNEGQMERTSRQTQCLVSKILQCYIKELKLTVLLGPLHMSPVDRAGSVTGMNFVLGSYEKLTTPENTITYHNALSLSPKILHKHCFQFLLGPF